MRLNQQEIADTPLGVFAGCAATEAMLEGKTPDLWNIDICIRVDGHDVDTRRVLTRWASTPEAKRPPAPELSLEEGVPATTPTQEAPPPAPADSEGVVRASTSHNPDDITTSIPNGRLTEWVSELQSLEEDVQHHMITTHESVVDSVIRETCRLLFHDQRMRDAAILLALREEDVEQCAPPAAILNRFRLLREQIRDEVG